jgi:hypothetical protein
MMGAPHKAKAMRTSGGTQATIMPYANACQVSTMSPRAEMAERAVAVEEAPTGELPSSTPIRI